MEKLTSQEEKLVQDTVVAQRKVYQEYITVTKHLRRIRALRLDTRTPRAFQRIIGKGVRAPLAWSIVQTINGMVAKSPPMFTRTPLNSGQKDRAARLASTCWPLLQTYSRMAHKDLFYGMADQLAGDGKGVVKLQRKMMKEYPDREQFKTDGGYDDVAYNQACRVFLSQPEHNPLRISLTDPTTFWPDRAFEPTYVVEAGNRPLLSTLKALGLKMGVNNTILEDVPQGGTVSEEMLPSGFSPTARIEELWTEDFCYFQIDGKVLKFKNEFGFIPYAWRAGMSTSIPDPVMESVSAVFPFYDLEPHLNTLLTSIVSWSILGGMPTAIIETAPNAGVAPGQEVPPSDIPLGQMVQLAPGRKFYYAAPPPIGDSVVQAVNMILSFYERAGVTQAARGIIGSRTPGLTFSSALEAASDMLLPITHSLEGLCEDITRMTWKAVEKLNMPLYVTGEELIEGTGRRQLSQHRITPSLIGKYYDIHCEIRPSSTQDSVQKGMHAAFMNQHQMWSQERAMNYSGVENPTAERLELLKDKIRNTPLYQQMAMKAALSDDPEAQQMVADAEAQGEDLLGLLEEGDAGGGGGENGSLPGGQIRGLPARAGGGREAGSARRPTGPRPVSQGSQFPS